MWWRCTYKWFNTEHNKKIIVVRWIAEVSIKSTLSIQREPLEPFSTKANVSYKFNSIIYYIHYLVPLSYIWRDRHQWTIWKGMKIYNSGKFNKWPMLSLRVLVTSITTTRADSPWDFCGSWRAPKNWLLLNGS